MNTRSQVRLCATLPLSAMLLLTSCGGDSSAETLRSPARQSTVTKSSVSSSGPTRYVSGISILLSISCRLPLVTL